MKSENSLKFEKIIPILGPFHQQLSFIYCICKRFRGSGISDVLVSAGVIAEGWSSSVTDSGNALGLAGNSRGYLTSSADGGLLRFNLLSKILRFTADVSRVPCSVNAALYFVDMAGAYCDIQTDN